MDINSLDLTKLESLRIHELRDVARELGVKSPTALTKERILEQINMIVTGEKEPYFNVRKQGRPTKTEEVDLSAYVNVPKKDAHLKPWTAEAINPSYVLRCNEFELTRSLPTDRIIMGYVDIHPEGYGLIRRSDFIPRPLDTFIPVSLVSKFNLVSGMYIRGVERFVANGKPYALIAVESAERCAENYDSILGDKLGKKIYSYLNIDVFSGGRYLIKNEKPKDIFLNAYDIAASVAKTNEDVQVRVINIKSIDERLPKNSAGFETLNIPFNTSDKDIINAVNLYMAKVKIEALSQKMVVVLVGLTELAKAYNNVLNEGYSNSINMYTATKINNVLAAAKNIKEGTAGITLIAVDNMKLTDEMKEMFEYDILDNFSN